MYDTILIATDGSEDSDGAVVHGLALARAFDATVHALSVVDLVPTALGIEGVEMQDTREELLGAAERAVEAVEERGSRQGIDVVTTVEEGQPAPTILDYAEECGADLVVVGTGGKGRLARFLLGSVSEKVFRRADAPVLTVPHAAANAATAYEDILVATDGGDSATRAVDQALGLGAGFGATVHVVYVVDDRFAENPAIREALTALGERAVNDVAVRGAERDVTVVERIERGAPHEEILDYAEECGADVLALGTHGRSGLDRFVTGSVAERVVRGARAPVLTARQSGEE